MKQTLLLCLLISSLTGCYTSTVVPDSIIPAGCLVGMTETFGENGKFEREVWLYDAFGQLTRHYIQDGIVNAANTGTTRVNIVYTYDTQHYLIKRTEGVASTTEYTYEYEGTPRRLRRITSPNSTDTYTYEGEQLTRLTRTYNGETYSTTTYGTDGKLKSMDDKSGSTYEITNGLIRRVTYSDQTYTLFIYTNEGYESEATFVNPGRKQRIVYSYTTDNKPVATASQLRFRGIPDLVGADKKSNRTSRRIQFYENDVLTIDETTRYTFSYNNRGVPTGYTTSTGERVTYYYPNCTAP